MTKLTRPFELFTKNPAGTLIHHSSHSTFQSAVKIGRFVAGYGNFHVDSPTVIPSSAEQLLQDSPKQTILDSI